MKLLKERIVEPDSMPDRRKCNMKYGFIGTGNMGGTLARAVAKKVEASQIGLSNRTQAKANALAAELGANAVTNCDIAKQAAFILLGVKPQLMEGCLEEIKGELEKRTDRFVIVTMAAGLSIAKIRELAGGDYPVIRIMPNTPASIGQGVTLLCSEGVSQKEINEFKSDFAATGVIDDIAEQLMDAACAVSGCGPAFVYMCIEAMADGAVQCGIPRAKALLYAAKTFEGSAALVLESGTHPGVLKDAVCSPGGSTIAGVHALEADGVRNAFMDAVVAAFKRTRELG